MIRLIMSYILDDSSATSIHAVSGSHSSRVLCGYSNEPARYRRLTRDAASPFLLGIAGSVEFMVLSVIGMLFAAIGGVVKRWLIYMRVRRKTVPVLKKYYKKWF